MMLTIFSFWMSDRLLFFHGLLLLQNILMKYAKKKKNIRNGWIRKGIKVILRIL